MLASISQAVGADLSQLRLRADEDFASPSLDRGPGRHQIDLPSLGLRVSLTRSRYPNRRDGTDLYVLTVSHLGLAMEPDEDAVAAVLSSLFGEAAGSAQLRPGGSPLIRLYRIPA
jgi:hypothetical protein